MAKTDDGQDDEGSVSAKDEPKQTKRRYNASCLLCRRKRQKCPGRDENGKNLCTSCEARGVPCEYPQNPDATKYDEALELRDLVDSLLRADGDHRNQLLEAWQSKKKRKLSDVTGEGNGPAATNTRKRPAMRASPPVISNLPLASNKLEHDVHAGHFINFRRVKECEKYVSAAIAPAIHTTTRQCYLTDAELDTFLDVFFRWHNPRFLFPRQLVYNHAKNPSYKAIYPNDLLISSIFTYASRHLMNRQDLGEKFCARAHCLLAEELCKEPSIATVQGIGLLSMHHATNGRNGQSLSLVGLAQKMMQAMSMSRIGRPRLEQRMFCRTAWAVFNWHVMFSLLMNQLTPLEAPSIADLKEELAPLEDEEKETSNQQQYCPEGGSDDLWKEVFLRSAEAFNYLYEILQALYANPDRSQSSMQSYVYKTRETLLQWQAGMSSDILIDTDNMPSTAPSPSIVQFNLLVRTLWILLYRRFDESFGNSFTLAGAKSASAFNAKEIYEICRNFEQNLSFNFLNYISIFAAEMAAVTDVHGLPRETPQQKEALCTRMSLYIRVLQTGEINCPGMAPMVEALRREKEGIDPCAEFLVTAPPSRSASCDIEVPESERDVTQLDSIWGHFRYQPQL